VTRFAIATGRAVRDPTADLRGALTPIKVTNRAAITEPRQACAPRSATKLARPTSARSEWMSGAA
jgi:hypothetical protein